MDAVIEGCKNLSATINQTVLAASAIITVSIAIYEKVVKEQTKLIKTFVRSTWLCLLLSIVFGFFAGHHISFYLINQSGCESEKEIAERLTHIKIASFLHFLLFVFGITTTIVFGWLSVKPSNLSSSGSTSSNKDSPHVHSDVTTMGPSA